MLLVVAYAVVSGIDDGIIPGIAWLMWQASIFGGVVATYFYGLYVTIRARAWGWVVLCAIPVVGSVPASIAYAWIRRGELERQILAEEQDPGA